MLKSNFIFLFFLSPQFILNSHNSNQIVPEEKYDTLLTTWKQHHIMVNCGMQSWCSTHLVFLPRMQSLITNAEVLRTFPKGRHKCFFPASLSIKSQATKHTTWLLTMNTRISLFLILIIYQFSQCNRELPLHFDQTRPPCTQKVTK